MQIVFWYELFLGGIVALGCTNERIDPLVILGTYALNKVETALDGQSGDRHFYQGTPFQLIHNGQSG